MKQKNVFTSTKGLCRTNCNCLAVPSYNCILPNGALQHHVADMLTSFEIQLSLIKILVSTNQLDMVFDFVEYKKCARYFSTYQSNGLDEETYFAQK